MSGELLNRANLMGVNLNNPSWTADNTMTPNGGTRYLYIACWAFNFKFVGNYALLGSPDHQVSIQHWNGSSWVNDETRTLKNASYEWGVNRYSTLYGYITYPTFKWRIRFVNSTGYYKGEGDGYLWLHAPGEYDSGLWDTNVRGKQIACLGTSQYLVYQTADSPPSSFSIYSTTPQRGSAINSGITKCRIVPLGVP